MDADSVLASAASPSQLDAAKPVQDGNVLLEPQQLLSSGAISVQPIAQEVKPVHSSVMAPAARPMVQISTATGGVYLPPPPPPVRSLEDMEAEQAEKAKKGAHVVDRSLHNHLIDDVI